MPTLIARIDVAASGLDLAQLAGSLGGQIGGLATEFGGWATQPPGDFGAALSGVTGIAIPQINVGADFGHTLAGLAPSLQGALGPLAADLQGRIANLPASLQGDLALAIKPLLDNVAAMQTLLTSDWSCGLLPVLTPPPAPVSPLPAPAPAPGDPPPAAPAPASGAVSTAQVTRAKAMVDTLPATLDVPGLFRWLHDRVQTFRPGYFTVRSLPLVDDIRDPLDTLLRWDDASAADLAAELQQTLDALAALIRAHSGGIFARALPAPALAALPLAPLATAAGDHADAVEALATAVQANAADIAARLAAAQAAQAALQTQNDALAAAAAERAQLAAGLASAAGDLDAGVCRLLVLLQPRATLADLAAPVGGFDVPAPSPLAVAPLTDLFASLSGRLTDLLDTIDVTPVTAPLTAVFTQIDGVVGAIEQGFAQLSATAAQQLGELRTAVEALGLDDLRQQVEDALDQATEQVGQALAATVGGASASLTDALATAQDAIDAIDPEALAGPINDAIDALGDLAQDEIVTRLVDLLHGLSGLADQLDDLSFAPVTDEVIAAIGEVRALIAGIDISKLPDPGPALIGEALKVLPQSIVPLTDPLVAELGRQIAGSPTALLEQVKALPEQVRERLLQFSPRAALTPVLVEPFNAAVAQLDAVDPSAWLAQADGALAGLRQALARQLDIGALLRPAGAAHAALLGALDGFEPSRLLAPLKDALAEAAEAVGAALPIGDVAQALNQSLARARNTTATIEAALEVADHLAQKIAALGDAEAEFADWVDQILAKVPETPAGTLAAALDGVIDAAQGARPADLRAAWATARQPLADALAAAEPQARLSRVLLARGRIAAGLAPLADADRAALQAWLALPATPAATAGLTQIGALAVALTTADTRIAAHIDELATQFPAAGGPLAPLLPGGADRPLRQWLRDAALRQLGTPAFAFLKSLKLVGALLAGAVSALRTLLTALTAKVDALLAAPAALAALLGRVDAVKDRLLTLDLDVYTREIDALYAAAVDQVRALDPRSLEAPLVAARDRLIGALSLAALLPPALRAELDAAYHDLVAKLGSLDPDALLLQPLDARYAEAILPLVNALQVGPAVQKVIDWLNGLDEQLNVEIGRVDVAYRELLSAAPGGGGAGGSVSVSI